MRAFVDVGFGQCSTPFLIMKNEWKSSVREATYTAYRFERWQRGRFVSLFDDR